MKTSLQGLYQKLSFKIGALIIITEVVALFGLGIFYIERFTSEIEQSIQQKFQTPGYLMAKGLLRYESAEDRTTMENLVGETLEECIILGANNKIYYSLKPEQKGKAREDIPVMAGFPELKQEIADPKFMHSTYNGTNYLVNIHPMRLEDGKFLGHLFILAKTDKIDQQKSSIIIMFVLGSLLCLILSSIVIIFLFNKYISSRIHILLNKLHHLTDGKLSNNKTEVESPDEIGQLENSISNLNLRLREIVSTIIEGSDRVAQNSLEMNDISIKVAEGANKQAASAEEVSSSIEEMTANIQENADNAVSNRKNIC